MDAAPLSQCPMEFLQHHKFHFFSHASVLRDRMLTHCLQHHLTVARGVVATMRNRKEQSVKIAEPATDIRPRTTLGTPFWRFAATALLGVAALFACGVINARAQDPFGSDTSTPTAIPGGAAAIGEPTAVWTPSPSRIKNPNPQVILLPAPSIAFNVGGQPIFPPNNECARRILSALRQHSAVAVPASGQPQVDQRCSEEMNRALTLERTRPECASGPCW